MELRLSMVHNNPGEPPFNTKFHNPKVLKEYGFNGQVFKHINTVISFDRLGIDLFAGGSPEKEWLDNFSLGIRNEIQFAKENGLSTFYHIDLFVLPKKIVEHYKDEICDENGQISIDKEKTLELHRVLFDELFSTYPNVDGLIIRIGETYLNDAPYHIGNGAINYGDTENEKRQFVKLLKFLREEVCVKHNKKLIFRTWDCFRDKFHSNPEYYLDVTSQIEAHENLCFSMKFTALDFWRYVRWNDCISKGKHKQIIEIQCQREYEGKGAMPSYVANLVINGDYCNKTVIGLKDVANNPLISGVYVWPRGGGWDGPYSPDEFWSDLNTYVVANYAADTKKTEEEIFKRYVNEKMGLFDKNAEVFRKLALLANEAILKSRYITPYDKNLNEIACPCCNWLRDDVIGGHHLLKNAFDVMFEQNTLLEALEEKADGLSLWKKILTLSQSIEWGSCDKKEFIVTSCEYAVKLFEALYYTWEIMIYGYLTENGISKVKELKKAIESFDVAYEEYQKLKNNKNAATLYSFDHYRKNKPGIMETVNYYREMI